MLTSSDARERFQPIAGQADQVPQRFRVVQDRQPPGCLIRKAVESPDELAAKETLRSPVHKTSYQ